MTTPSDASQAVELPPLPAKTVHELEPDSVRCVHLGHSDAAMCAFARAAIAQDRAARAQAEQVSEEMVIAAIRALGVHVDGYSLDKMRNALRASARAQAEEIHQPTNREDAEAGNVNAIRHVAYGEGYRDGKEFARAQGAGEAVAMGSTLQRVMSRLADMLDDDKFNEIEGIVHAGGLTAPTIPQAAEVPGFVLVPHASLQMVMQFVDRSQLGIDEQIADCENALAAAPTPTASAPKACPHGDRFCPCPDGDTCHYEGANPSPAPKAEGEAAGCKEQCWACAESGIGCNLLNDGQPAPAVAVEAASEQHAACASAHRWLLAHEWRRQGDYFVKIGHCEAMGVDVVALIVGAALAARSAPAVADGQWISVEDRLPDVSGIEDGETVLVANRGGSFAAEWHGTGITGFSSIHGDQFVEVTHWMQLPATPTTIAGMTASRDSQGQLTLGQECPRHRIHDCLACIRRPHGSGSAQEGQAK